MSILLLSLKSLRNRRLTAGLTVAAIALSVTLLLGVERIREGARSSFENTVSGTDLIVGARSGDVQLLLNSVFRIGVPPTDMSWETYQALKANPDVAWIIPIMLGDSHRGFRVMGTSPDYFEHLKYGRGQSLAFAQGGPFRDVFDTVLGSDVAQALGYELGDKLTISHGISDVGLQVHETKPFAVVGVLAPTHTPVDRTVHIGLEGVMGMHVDFKSGQVTAPEQQITEEEARRMDLTPMSITAAFLGLKSKFGMFRLQRYLSGYKAEALSAILPGVALGQLWQTLSVAETALRTVSAFVVLTGLLGMLTAILTTLNERRREMAILRSVGARPLHVFVLMVSEAFYLAFAGCVAGVVLLYAVLTATQPWIENRFGLFLPIQPLNVFDWVVLGVILAAGLLVGCLPAWRAYRNALADGLTIRL